MHRNCTRSRKPEPGSVTGWCAGQELGKECWVEQMCIPDCSKARGGTFGASLWWLRSSVGASCMQGAACSYEAAMLALKYGSIPLNARPQAARSTTAAGSLPCHKNSLRCRPRSEKYSMASSLVDVPSPAAKG